VLYRRKASSAFVVDLPADALACERCGVRLETYDEATLGSLVVACGTLLHRDPHLAAPFVLDMLLATARLAHKKQYSWQASAKFFLPANYASVARQFLRCALHKLQNNEILFQLFQCAELATEPGLLATVAAALADWAELSAVAALRQLLADLNMQKALRLEVALAVLGNAAAYMEHLPLEAPVGAWASVVAELETLLRGLEPLLVRGADLGCVLRVVATLLRTPAAVKPLLEPFGRLLAFALRHCPLRLEQLVDVCALSTRKDRGRQHLARGIVAELVASVTVKVGCRDRNLLQVRSPPPVRAFR